MINLEFVKQRLTELDSHPHYQRPWTEKPQYTEVLMRCRDEFGMPYGELPQTTIKKAEAFDDLDDTIEELLDKKARLDAREKTLDEYEAQLEELAKRLGV